MIAAARSTAAVRAPFDAGRERDAAVGHEVVDREAVSIVGSGPSSSSLGTTAMPSPRRTSACTSRRSCARMRGVPRP